AWTYAEKRQENIGGTPHVYRVTPKNPHDLEEDPRYEGEYNRANYEGDMRSRSGCNVLDEVPPIRRMHREMKQDHQDEYNAGGWDNGDEDEDDWEHEASRHTDSKRYYHGTTEVFQPGDLVTGEHELGRRRGKPGYAFVTGDPQAAHNYGRYKAQAQWAIGNDDAEPHAYEVEPTGPIEPDDTVDERFDAWRSTHPFQVVRKLDQGRTAAREDWPALSDEHYEKYIKPHEGPQEPETFWRAHLKDRPFSRDDAWSADLSGGEEERGYSAFKTPHELHRYLTDSGTGE